MIGKLLARKGILSRREQELRAREQELLQRLAAALERFGTDVASDDVRRFQEAREQLTGLFLLVVAGEFNSGKSSFINALLGERVLPEGVTPTTDRINVLRHGDEVSEQLREAYLLERTHPAEVLREISIVDTPGTNAIIRRHEELTRDFVPRSDLVLFVTSADRPFTESERAFLEQIREWGKKIVFIINKMDILSRPEERKEVVQYVATNAAPLLGETPMIFGVSARQAQEARGEASAGTPQGEELWRESGFGPVEDYLLKTLDQEERVRLKLLNPLNVGLRLASKYKDATFERLKLLARDVEALQNIDQQLALYHQEMLRDFEPRLARLDVLLGDMERRGTQFFEENIRIGRIRSLMDSEGIKRAFEREVIGETPKQLEEEVGRVIDWIVERNHRLWQDINTYIERRQLTRHHEGMIGDVGPSFSYNRQALLDSIGRVSRDVVGSYNREAESRSIANDIQGAFATTALAEAGAVGLGTIVVTMVTGAAADVTGILLATALAVGGFYVLPRKRRQAQRDFQQRIAELRTQLKNALTRQVHLELEQSTARINEAIAPYRRFVQSQQLQLNEARGELVATEDALMRLRADIEKR
ncbi:MAG TPA: dynamin family protein [Gemmatimonadales bacterium]|nr:dynamin family protein [Gemmatimonadales bacterium]